VLHLCSGSKRQIKVRFSSTYSQVKDLGNDHFTMGYFDNLYSGFLEKYEKKLNNKKNINMLFYLYIDNVLNFM
jgi:hypothetical protein